MKYQKQLLEVFEKFKDNEECLQCFLNCFDIPELKDLKELKCVSFSDYPLAESIQEDPKVSGFVIFSRVLEVYFISPTMNYIGFWGFRNFFTYRLALKHKSLNDGILRYVVNIHNKQDLNRKDHFNDIREFVVFNVYKYTEDLRDWILALFEG